MPDETIPPADSSRPDERRSPFDGFRRDEFTFHSFDGGQPPSPPADEPPAYYDDPDEDDPDPADVFMAVTVDGQTLKATPAPPVTLGPRRTSRGRQRRRTTSTARQTGLQMVRTIVLSLLAAVLVSTIFSLWTRPTFLPDTFRAELNQVQATQQLVNIQPTPLPTDVREIRIGIVAGHSGKPQDETFDEDPGAVCPDGLTELSINTGVARAVVAALQRDNYEVDLLEEFDPRLRNYRADVLVSIHTNDCSNYGPAGTGYNGLCGFAGDDSRRRRTPARLLDPPVRRDDRPAAPFRDHRRHDVLSHVRGSLGRHAGRDHQLGFMLSDRRILTEQQDLLAQGVATASLFSAPGRVPDVPFFVLQP